MKRYLLMFLLLATSNAFGGNFYFSQNGAGAQNGTSSGNAWSLATVNAGGLGYGAGDTLHGVGVITNLFTGIVNGSTGNPFTLLLDPGAKFSAPTWPANSSIISGTFHDVVLDGGGNSVGIEATDNGWQKTFSNNFSGINITPMGGVEIRNWSMVNFNPRLSNNVDNACAPNGIRAGGTMTNFLIHNNSMTNLGNCIVVFPQTGISTNIQVYSNNCFGCSWGIYCESAGSGSMFYNTRIWRNRINNGTGWDAINPGPFHNDGIIVGVPSLNSSNINMKIYWNIIGPDSGYDTTTSALYWETTQISPYNQNGLIFGNVFMCKGQGQHWNSGFVSINGSGMGVYNNTFVSQQMGQGGNGLDAAGGFGAISPFLENNLFYHQTTITYSATQDPPNLVPTNGFSAFDYNYMATAEDTSHGFGIPGLNTTTFWLFFKGGYVENAGTNNNPLYVLHGDGPEALLDTNGYCAPLTNDTVVVGHGTNLTALSIALGVPELTLDINGAQRSSSNNWTIGAFELPSTNTPPPPPPPTFTLTVNNGTGSASGLTAGQVITISTNSTIWSGWTGPGVSFIAGQTPTTTLTMPASDTSITANYTNAPGIFVGNAFQGQFRQ